MVNIPFFIEKVSKAKVVGLCLTIARKKRKMAKFS
jgi:hypothetical protein